MLLVVEFFLGVCSSLYPLVYGCVLRIREGAWPSREMVWGSEGENRRDEDDGSGRVGQRSVSIAEYTLVGLLILGIWEMLKGGEESYHEEVLGRGEDEKLRLMEEGDDGVQ